MLSEEEIIAVIEKISSKRSMDYADVQALKAAMQFAITKKEVQK